MEREDKSWPLLVGITAGIVGGIVAGLYLYTMRTNDESDVKLRDAKDIISLCHERIKEIEAGLESLRKPLAK